MASVATRTPKRELAPDWRDVLRETVRRFVVRLGGARRGDEEAVDVRAVLVEQDLEGRQLHV